MDSSTPIELAVYAARTDTLLFVPAMCLPPREAQDTFGPLDRVGTVTVTELDAAWSGIVSQIERHLFATIPRAQGEFFAGLLKQMRTPQPMT